MLPACPIDSRSSHLFLAIVSVSDRVPLKLITRATDFYGPRTTIVLPSKEEQLLP